MEFESATAVLKKRLQLEVARFYKRDHRLWKEPVVEMLRELKLADLKAVFFGGTLRSLLVSRLFLQKPGRPRDVDIVISGASIDTLKQRFEVMISRETRFGGLQLRRREWQFDVWPLSKTWAFVHDAVASPAFAALPSTTFFNLEAIAVEIWPSPGKTRDMFSGNDQFFKGILTKTLEINREDNPFPGLCVLRALVMAGALDFMIGPQLAAYIARHGERMTAKDFEEIQQKHYGQRRRDGQTLREWVLTVADQHNLDTTVPIRLPIRRQLDLWAEPEEPVSVRVHAIAE